MRTPVSFLAVVPMTVLLLSGCTPTAPPVTPGPAPSSTPAFASDEEALAAATKAYEEYLAMSDTIAADGGADPERMTPFVTKSQLKNELQGFMSIKERGYHTTGSSGFDSVSLESYQELADGPEVIVYLCLDSSNVHVMDAMGVDVTPADRVVRQPFELGFTSPSDLKNLVVRRSEVWTGSDFC